MKEQTPATRIVDINMPFWSLVGFMVKAAIAAIPAFIILVMIYMIVGAVIGGVIAAV